MNFKPDKHELMSYIYSIEKERKNRGRERKESKRGDRPRILNIF